MVMSQKKALIFTCLTTIILISAVAFMLTYDSEGLNVAGEASKYKVSSASTTTEYTWELDTSYVQRKQSGTLGRNSQQGANYHNNDWVMCEDDEVIVDILSNTDQPGGPLDYTQIDGLKVYCANPLPSGSNDLLVYTQPGAGTAWGYSSQSSLNGNIYVERGIRKLESTSTSSGLKFFRAMRERQISYPSDSNSPFVSASYDWKYITDTVSSGSIDSIDCPTSTETAAYLVSGLQVISTKRSPTGNEVIQGIKIYCTKFNRVAQ